MYILEHKLNLHDYNFTITILLRRNNYLNRKGLPIVKFEDKRNQFTKLTLISKMRDAAFLMRN